VHPKNRKSYNRSFYVLYQRKGPEGEKRKIIDILKIGQLNEEA